MEFWCVHCPQIPRRRELLEIEFGRERLNVNFWQSVHARSFGIEGVAWGPTDLVNEPHSVRAGYVGLAIGQWMLWQHLLLVDRPGPFVVFEDDVILAEGFKRKLASCYADLPCSWDVCVVGSQAIEKPEDHEHVAGNVYRFGEAWVLGMHAMLFKKSALRVLMAQNHRAELTIDSQLNLTSYRELNSYVIMPGLALQRSVLPEGDPRRVPFSCG